MSRRQHCIALLSVLQFFSSFCFFFFSGLWTCWELIIELDKYVPFMAGHLQSLIIHTFNCWVVFRCIYQIIFIHFFFSCWLPSGLISFSSYLFRVRQQQNGCESISISVAEYKFLWVHSSALFIMNECSIFPSFIEKVLWLLPLALSRCCHTFVDLDVFNLTGNCGMKPTRSWCVVFTNPLLNLFFVFFLSIFLYAYSLGLMTYVLFRFFPYLIFKLNLKQYDPHFIEWVLKHSIPFYFML